MTTQLFPRQIVFLYAKLYLMDIGTLNPGISAESNTNIVCKSSDILLFSLLMHTVDNISEKLDGGLVHKFELPLREFEVLLKLEQISNNTANMGKLSHSLNLTTGGMTRLVDRLVSSGLVERVACPNDRRVVYVKLTNEGIDLLQAAKEEYYKEVKTNLTAKLNETEIEQLKSILKKLE